MTRVPIDMIRLPLAGTRVSCSVSCMWYPFAVLLVLSLPPKAGTLFDPESASGYASKDECAERLAAWVELLNEALRDRDGHKLVHVGCVQDAKPGA